MYEGRAKFVVVPAIKN